MGWVVYREDLGKLQGFHLGMELFDLPSLSVGVFGQFDDPIEQAPAHFLELLALPIGKVRLVFAVRKMPLLLDLKHILVTLAAVKHRILRQLIYKFLRISLQCGHVIVVSPFYGGDRGDAFVICLFFADWRGELPSMGHLRALEFVLPIDLQSLHEFGLDTHGLILHALLYLLSPYRLLSDLSPHPRANLLPPTFLHITRHDPKRPIQIHLPAFILLLKPLGAIPHSPKQQLQPRPSIHPQKVINHNQSQYFEKSSKLLHFFSDGNSLMFYNFISSLGQGWSIGYSWGKGFSMFLQPQHLHASEQPTPELKHSQYRLRQPDFLQLHRFYARLQLLSPPSFTPILAWMISSLNSAVFLQPTQAQSSPHSFPVEKHSQYIFRHNVFLHVHPIFFFLVELVDVGTKEIRSPSESSQCCGGVLSRGNYMFSREE